MLAGAGVDELVADELTVLPGVEDLLALGEVRRAAETGPWEVVVVDCGPTAETLRLLGLPEALSGYLERLFPAHRRAVRGLLAGLAGGGRDAAPAWDAHRSTPWTRWPSSSPACARCSPTTTRTSIRLVLTPERVVAAETRRTLTALALHGLRVDGLVANRVVPGPPRVAARPGGALAAASATTEQQAVLAELAGLAVPLRTADHAAGRADRRAGAAGGGRLALRRRRPGGARRRPARRCCAVRRTAGAGSSPDSRVRAGAAAARRRRPARWTWPGSATSWPSPPAAPGGWWRCPRCCAAARWSRPGWRVTTCAWCSPRTRRCGSGERAVPAGPVARAAIERGRG